MRPVAQRNRGAGAGDFLNRYRVRQIGHACPAIFFLLRSSLLQVMWSWRLVGHRPMVARRKGQVRMACVSSRVAFLASHH